MDNRETRLYLTKKQALSVIPDSDFVHIFIVQGNDFFMQEWLARVEKNERDR